MRIRSRAKGPKKDVPASSIQEAIGSNQNQALYWDVTVDYDMFMPTPWIKQISRRPRPPHLTCRDRVHVVLHGGCGGKATR